MKRALSILTLVLLAATCLAQTGPTMNIKNGKLQNDLDAAGHTIINLPSNFFTVPGNIDWDNVQNKPTFVTPTDITNAVNAEATARTNADGAEATTRSNADAAEATARDAQVNAAIINLQNQIASAQATLNALIATKESGLGYPPADGYVLTSQTQGSGGARSWVRVENAAPAIVMQNASVTLTPDVRFGIFTSAITATRTYVLPLASQVPAGQKITIINPSNFLATFDARFKPQGSDSLNGSGSSSFTAMQNNYSTMTFISDGVNTWTLPLLNIAQGGTGGTSASSARSTLSVPYLSGVLMSSGPGATWWTGWQTIAPVTSTSAGTQGVTFVDGSFLYICYAPNQWRRVALSSF